MYIFIYIYTYMYIYVYVCVCVRVCVCVCVCVSVCFFPFVSFSDTYLAAKPVYLTTQNRAKVKQRLWKF